MADILRVTSPVINKNIIQPDKALKDPSVPFDMQEIRHITKEPVGQRSSGPSQCAGGRGPGSHPYEPVKGPGSDRQLSEKYLYAGGNHQSASCEQQYGDPGNPPAL